MNINVNLNESVKFRLSEFGLNYLAEVSVILGTDENVKAKKEEIINSFDADGYCEMQLWEVMNVFGRFLYKGAINLPFKDNEIFLKIN